MASTAPDQKMLGYGTKLYASDDGISYTQQFDLELATPPDQERDTAEVSVLDSPDFTREFIAGWINRGKMPFTILYAGEGAEYTTIQGYFDDGVIRWWKVVLPLLDGQNTAAFFVVKAFLTKCKITESKAGANDPLAIECELQVATATAFAFTEAT